ncbi:MAG: hypothetical protein ACPGWR_02815, partial [Ardenticatenaceae bacterium]
KRFKSPIYGALFCSTGIYPRAGVGRGVECQRLSGMGQDVVIMVSNGSGSGHHLHRESAILVRVFIVILSAAKNLVLGCPLGQEVSFAV